MEEVFAPQEEESGSEQDIQKRCAAFERCCSEMIRIEAVATDQKETPRV
jgi:hypothetical protein